VSEDIPAAVRLPALPRRANLFTAAGRSLVARVPAGEPVRPALARALDLLGGLGRLVRPGEAVLLKPNFNSPDPLPAATDLGLLRAMVELLKEAGASKITLGERSGRAYGYTTRQTLAKLGVLDLARELDFRVACFDEEEWVEVELGGRYVERLELPRAAYEADKRIYLPCLKTHAQARFTLALKVAFGFSNLRGRQFLHAGNLEEKVAELSLAWLPDLIVLDGRKAFVTNGPQSGTLVEPGLLLASADPVAIDVEGVRLLQSYNAANRLDMDPWQLPQIATAVAHGLGARHDGEYVVVS
jgi:uncharacterized protein (DUF362 family)